MTSAAFDALVHARKMRAGGFWLDTSYDEYLARAIRNTP